LREDHYKTLGVPNTATQEEIKKAYRRLASLHHPDKGGDEEKFKEINAAYSLLSDPEKRYAYDHRGRGTHPGFGPNMNSWEEVFGDFFRNISRRQAAGPTSEKDIRFNLGISLEQIRKGASQTIHYRKNIVCSPCSGKGGTKPERCMTCGGTAFVSRYNRHGTVIRTPCGTCRGQGIVFETTCGSCQGAGIVTKEESVTVKISEE